MASHLLRRFLFLALLVCSHPLSSQEIDVKNEWERHTIDIGIPRTYGVSASIGDLKNDGRMDMILVQGSNKGEGPTDGIF